MSATPERALTLADAIGIGVNGIVGSGIYLLVGPLARVGGTASVAGVLACGALCVLIALCFAELSSVYDRSGGPYVYARDAFGPWVGFGVANLAPLATSGASLLSSTTRADGFVLVPRDSEGQAAGESVTVFLYDGFPP